MERTCKQCATPIPPTKRPHAIYCDRKCKAASCEKRRPQRDHAARYLKEREHRLAYALDTHRMRAAAHKRRSRVRGAEHFAFTKRDWARLVARYRNCCAYCGQQKPLTTEHIVPLSRGGRHSAGNIVPACFSCNSSKRDRFITEWKLHIPSPHHRRGRCVIQEGTAR